MGYIFAVVLGYLLGCSHMAHYLGKLNDLDIRTAGSGNLGASNTVVLFGWGSGVLVAVHDIGKAFLAVWLARWLFPELPYAGAAAGVAAVLGHIFPFYLKFKGGKGLASFYGMALALDWKLALVLGIIIVGATLLTGYIALGAIGTALAAPVYVGLVGKDLLLAAILCIATVVILLRHRENMVRMATKQELGLWDTAQGQKRVK